MVRSITPALAAAASIMCLAGPAKAFDGATCNSIFGAGNIATVRQFTMETGTVGKVDFGDHLHLFGEPRGTAVVCWHHDGSVAVRGYVFADSPDIILACARVTFFHQDVVVYRLPDVCRVGNDARDRLVNTIRTDAGITRVRLELLRGSASTGVVSGVVPGGTKDLTR